ncbi:YpmS family protein [Peribacillus sp. JNUCC 23]|uniref:YpmS family protein n=1 Tax=Peribacillus sp. NPDC096379 TaxID=3364393 RepID=UPI000784788A
MSKASWKYLFLGLMAINIIVLVTLIILINLPAKDEEAAQIDRQDQGVSFVINTNRDDLNMLISQYIEKEGLAGPVHYDVHLSDVVELYGTMPFFGRDIELKLTFVPEAQNNGDVVLKQESISVGQLNLPVSYVLNFINRQYKTPEWVTIQPDKEQIYVSLQNMELKSDVHVKAKEFDLKNDKISFVLTVPSLQP